MYGLAIYSGVMATAMLSCVLLAIGWMIHLQQRDLKGRKDVSPKSINQFESYTDRESFLGYFHRIFRPVLKAYEVVHVQNDGFGLEDRFSRNMEVGDAYGLILIAEYKKDLKHSLVSTTWLLQKSVYAGNGPSDLQYQWLLEDLMRHEKFANRHFDDVTPRFVNHDTFPTIAYTFETRKRSAEALLNNPVLHARDFANKVQQAA